jgi:hypothetical protein
VVWFIGECLNDSSLEDSCRGLMYWQVEVWLQAIWTLTPTCRSVDNLRIVLCKEKPQLSIHIRGRDPWIWGQLVIPKRRDGITSLCRVKFQKTAILRRKSGITFPLSISSFLTFLWSHPITADVYFLVFPSFISFFYLSFINVFRKAVPTPDVINPVSIISFYFMRPF